jgi:hypothetical protein
MNDLLVIWKRAKRRAEEKGIPFTITLNHLNDMTIPITCPVLGISMKKGYSNKQSDNSLSIDRIDSKKGYEPGNIMFISWRANRLKNNATEDELIKIGEFYKQLKNGIAPS